MMDIHNLYEYNTVFQIYEVVNRNTSRITNDHICLCAVDSSRKRNIHLQAFIYVQLVLFSVVI